jgi:hypothetical protein
MNKCGTHNSDLDGGMKCPNCKQRMRYQEEGRRDTFSCPVCEHKFAQREGWACDECSTLWHICLRDSAHSESQRRMDKSQLARMESRSQKKGEGKKRK